MPALNLDERWNFQNAPEVFGDLSDLVASPRWLSDVGKASLAMLYVCLGLGHRKASP